MSQVERIEGRRHAVDTLALHNFSRRNWPAVTQSEVANNLRKSHGARATDFSVGVMEVLDAVAKG